MAGVQAGLRLILRELVKNDCMYADLVVSERQAHTPLPLLPWIARTGERVRNDLIGCF